MATVRAERDRPLYGIWHEDFVVFEFEGGTTVRLLAKRLLETPDEIVRAAAAVAR